MVAEFRPLREKEEKKYIKVHKYPIIFAILPSAMKKDYSNLSKSSIQLYATRLGLSKLDHDERVKFKKNQYNDAMYNTSSENLGLADLLRHRITYNYQTQTSNDGYTYLSTTEEVKSYIAEYGDCFGISDYQLALAMFFIGIESANLKEYHSSLVKQEMELFWKIIDRRGKQFE
jgi:hypothetical protein